MVQYIGYIFWKSEEEGGCKKFKYNLVNLVTVSFVITAVSAMSEYN